MAKSQITNIEVKKNNRNRIFRYICEHKSVSNPDIAYELKISLPTVTQNTKELIERGLVEEIGELRSTGGRRAKELSVASNFRAAIGLDITRNHISFILVNLVGDVLKYDRISLPFIQSNEYYTEVAGRMERFLEDAAIERERILGIGISLPGIVNLEKEEITYSHVLEVEKISFQSISSFFSFPCWFLNDANAGAYAEGMQSKLAERFFYLSLSNTVGGAIFSQGELVQGQGFRCGEVGHMTIVLEGEPCYCGKKGCLDSYCSARNLSGLTNGKLESFFAELKNGNKMCVDAWNHYIRYLAVAVNNIHLVLDCDIVLGGYVGSCIEEYMPEIRDKVSQRNIFAEDNTFVRSCNYKIGAAAMGAALRVIENFIEQV